jgi:predicted phosphodiesterase
VAGSAAAAKPDLAIHAGDYVYVTPDNWTNWYYQFFKPARKLLEAAPWIFVRGNHEICSQRGGGYFLLLDPRASTACASDSTPPYAVSLGKANFIVLDSSGATCDFPPGSPEKSCKASEQAEQIKTLTSQLKSSQSMIPPGASAMLLTHGPVWGAKTAKSSDPTPQGFCPASTKGDSNKRLLLSLNSSLAGAWTQANPTWITMVLSGHTHLFEVMTYTGGPLPQVVVGASGVELSHKVPKSLSDCKLSTVTGFLQLSTLNSRDKFGYGILNGSGSKLDVYKSDGTRALKCGIGAASAKCK